MAFVSFAAAKRDHRVRDALNAISMSEDGFRDAVLTEALGTPTWARRAPNLGSNRSDLNLQVDIALAVAAAFVAT
jgi:hypothetical protein